MHLLKIYSTQKADLEEARRRHQVTRAGDGCADALHAATRAPLRFKAEKGKETTRFGSWGMQRYQRKALSLAALTLLICRHTKTFFVNRKEKNSTRTSNNIWSNISWQFSHLLLSGFFWEPAGSLFHVILKSGMQAPLTMLMRQRKTAPMKSPPLPHPLH